jgi:hypothetical protein
MTKYFWYNGSTSFVGGEEFEREREDEVKAKREERGQRLPITKTRNVVSYS